MKGLNEMQELREENEYLRKSTSSGPASTNAVRPCVFLPSFH